MSRGPRWMAALAAGALLLAWPDAGGAQERPAVPPAPDAAAIQAYRTAQEYFSAGRYREARELLERVVAARPPSEHPYQLLGLVHLELGENQRALAAFEQADLLRPDFALTHYHKALAHTALQHNDKARAAIARALELRPALHQAYFVLGQIEEAEEHFKEAEAAFRRVTEIDRKVAPAWNKVGLLLLRRQDLAGAEEAFRRALVADAGYHAARYGLGRALCGQGKTAEGEKELAEFQRLSAIDAEIRKETRHRNKIEMLLADARECADQGRLDEAETLYRQVLLYDPNERRARAALLDLERRGPAAVTPTPQGSR